MRILVQMLFWAVFAPPAFSSPEIGNFFSHEKLKEVAPNEFWNNIGNIATGVDAIARLREYLQTYTDDNLETYVAVGENGDILGHSNKSIQFGNLFDIVKIVGNWNHLLKKITLSSNINLVNGGKTYALSVVYYEKPRIYILSFEDITPEPKIEKPTA